MEATVDNPSQFGEVPLTRVRLPRCSLTQYRQQGADANYLEEPRVLAEQTLGPGTSVEAIDQFGGLLFEYGSEAPHDVIVQKIADARRFIESCSKQYIDSEIGERVYDIRAPQDLYDTVTAENVGQIKWENDIWNAFKYGGFGTVSHDILLRSNPKTGVPMVVDFRRQVVNGLDLTQEFVEEIFFPDLVYSLLEKYCDERRIAGSLTRANTNLTSLMDFVRANLPNKGKFEVEPLEAENVHLASEEVIKEIMKDPKATLLPGGFAIAYGRQVVILDSLKRSEKGWETILVHEGGHFNSHLRGAETVDGYSFLNERLGGE